MKISEINEIIDNVVAEEVKRTIIKESKEMKKEVYHIKCEGVPLATFDTEAEAKENLPHYKAKHKGELIIEKGVYESQNDMIDKLDEMNDQLEETDNMKNTEMNEKLVGNQSKLDKNHNGKIDAQDFKILKGQKNEEEECQECSANMEEELHGNQDRIDADNDGKISANDFKMLLKKKKESINEDFSEYSNDALADMIVNLSRYEGNEEIIKMVKKELEKRKKKKEGDIDEESLQEGENDVYSIWEKYSGAALKENDPNTFSDEFEYADNVISHIVSDAIQNGDISEEDEEELTDELKDTYGYDLFGMFGSDEDFDDMDDDSEEIDENKGMCNECGGMLNEEGMCNECGGTMYESKKKRTIRVTESELAEMIAKMVNESIPGLESYKKAHKESGKQNKEGIDAMMKDVNKNHIDVEGNDKPEFPHAIGKGEKVARKNTKEQDEEVAKNFAGLQNLDYDNEPDEKFKSRLKMAIEGDRLMGNAPTTDKTDVVTSNGAKAEENENKEGNTIETPETAKKLEKQAKDRQKDKDERVLYKKEAVPVKESKVSFNNVLLEEINKMKSLSSYNKKTQ